MDRTEFDALPPDALLTLADVLAVVGVSRSTWYKGVKEDRFPQPTAQPIRQRPVKWKVADIRRLLAALPTDAAQTVEPMPEHAGSAAEQGLKPARPKVKRKKDLL